MRITHRTTGIVISIAISLLLTSAISVLSLDWGPTAVPSDTRSLTLEDIYNRLNSGTSGSALTFTEPTTAVAEMTMHTLDQIMAKAPAPVSIASGAAITDVLTGKTFWGLSTPGGVWGLASGTGIDIEFRALVPKTGITPSGIGRNPKEDATLQNGVAWPNPRFTISPSGLTVTDNLTGLVWTKNASNSGIKLSWANAITSCSALNVSGYGGYSDWRLPSVQELSSLIDFAYTDPALSNTSGAGKWTEGAPFNGVSVSYWSSTTDAASTGNAWYMDLDEGNVENTGKASTKYVWPVRGGQR